MHAASLSSGREPTSVDSASEPARLSKITDDDDGDDVVLHQFKHVFGPILAVSPFDWQQTSYYQFLHN